MALRVIGVSLLVLALLVTAIAGETVRVSTTPVFSAIPWGQQRDDFEVLVRVEAPAAKRRAPIDLIAVLDVSDSMNNNAEATSLGGSTRLDLLKKAMKFIIEKLDDGDRLAIVAFSDHVVQEHSTDLLCISGDGRSDARRKVDELRAGGGTAFKPALERAVQILDEQPADRDRVGFVLLLSDGIENSGIKWCKESIAGRTTSLIRAGLSKYQVHTFGFGASHDPKALHFIAQESRGTYSFVDENLDSITGAFAVCLGGLKTVVAVDTRIKLTAAAEHHGGAAQIKRIQSGGYRSHVSRDRTWGEIVLDVLYAGEVKNFIVRLHVPALDAACFDHHQQQQLLLTLGAGHSSHSHAMGTSIEAGNDVVLYIKRPKVVADAGRQAPSPAVVSHIVRFELLAVVAKFVHDELDDFEEAIATVDLGSRLEGKWEEFTEGHKFWSGVDLGDLDRDMSAMVSSLRRGRSGEGAAYVYSWVSSYRMQRATTMGSPDKVVPEFLTSEMRLMLKEARDFQVSNGRHPTAGGQESFDLSFERIDRRLELWDKLKREVPLLFQQPSDGESNQLTAVMQEASLDAINRAMHHDMYLAVVHASNVRRCYSSRGGRGAAAAC